MSDAVEQLEAMLRRATNERDARTLLNAALEIRSLRRALGPRRMAVLDNAREAQRLSAAGWSVRAIAKELNRSPARVHALVNTFDVEFALTED